MRVIVGDRQTGKTTTLIEEMAQHPGSVMVCASSQMAGYTQHLAAMLYPDISWAGRFIPFSMGSVSVRGSKRLYVDDLDLCLAQVFGTEVKMASVNGELFDTEEQARLKLVAQLRAQQQGE